MKGLIFTYALTYGGSLVSLFNPFYGLLIYFCFAIIKPESLWYWSVPEGNYSRIIAIALLIGWALNGFGNWDFGRAGPIVYALIGFWLWAVVCTFVSAPDKAIAMRFIENQGKIVLPFVVGITLIDSVEKLKQVAWVLMISQAYVAYDLNVAYYSGYNRVYEVGSMGMDNNSASIAMVAGAGLAFFLGLGTPNLWAKLLSFLCAGLMAHVPMFAMSRGGMLGLLVLGIVSFVLIEKRLGHYLAFATAAVCGALLAGPSVWQRFSTSFVNPEELDGSARSRIDMWWNCIDVMTDKPLFGAGPDHWPRLAAQYGWPEGKEAHSLWLQIGAELGFPGFIFLLAFYALTVWLLWRFIRRPSEADPWLKHAARMVIAASAGFAVSASFVSIEGLELPYYIVLLGAGTILLAEREDEFAMNRRQFHQYPLVAQT